MVCQTEVCVCVCVVPVLGCLSLWTSVWQLDWCCPQTPADYCTCSQDRGRLHGAERPVWTRRAAHSLQRFLKRKQTYEADDNEEPSLWTWPGLTFVKVYKSLRSREQGRFLFWESRRWAAGELYFLDQQTIPSSNDELKSFRKSWLTLITENFDLSGLFKQWRNEEGRKSKDVERPSQLSLILNYDKKKKSTDTQTAD